MLETSKMSQRRLSRKGVLLGFDRIFDEEGGLAILGWESRFEGGEEKDRSESECELCLD